MMKIRSERVFLDGEESLQKVYLFGNYGYKDSRIQLELSRQLKEYASKEGDSIFNMNIIEYGTMNTAMEMLAPLLLTKCGVFIICFNLTQFFFPSSRVPSPTTLSVRPTESGRSTPPTSSKKNLSSKQTTFIEYYCKLLSDYVLERDMSENLEPVNHERDRKVIFLLTSTEDEKTELLPRINKKTINDVYHLINTQLNQYIAYYKLDHHVIYSTDHKNFFISTFTEISNVLFPSIIPSSPHDRMQISGLELLVPIIYEYFDNIIQKYVRIVGKDRNTLKMLWRHYQNFELEYSYQEWVRTLKLCSHLEGKDRDDDTAYVNYDDIRRLTYHLKEDGLIHVLSKRRISSNQMFGQTYHHQTIYRVIVKPISFISNMPFDLLNHRTNARLPMPSPPPPPIRAVSAGTTHQQIPQPPLLQRSRTISSMISLQMFRTRSTSIGKLTKEPSTSSIASSVTSQTASSISWVQGGNNSYNSCYFIKLDLSDPEKEWFDQYGYLPAQYFKQKEISETLLSMMQSLGVVCPLGSKDKTNYFYSVLPFALKPLTELCFNGFRVYMGVQLTNDELIEGESSIKFAEFKSLSFPSYFHHKVLARVMTKIYEIMTEKFGQSVKLGQQYLIKNQHQITLTFFKDDLMKVGAEGKKLIQQQVLISYVPEKRLYSIDFQGSFTKRSSFILTWIEEQFKIVLKEYYPNFQGEIKTWYPIKRLKEPVSTVADTYLMPFELKEIEKLCEHLSPLELSQQRQRLRKSYSFVKKNGFLIPLIFYYFRNIFPDVSSFFLPERIQKTEKSNLHEKGEEDDEEDFESSGQKTSAHKGHHLIPSWIKENKKQFLLWQRYFSQIPIISSLSKNYITVMSSELVEPVTNVIHKYANKYYESHYQKWRKLSHPLKYYSHYSRQSRITSLTQVRSTFQCIASSYAVLLVYNVKDLKEKKHALLLEWLIISILKTSLEKFSLLQEVKVIFINEEGNNSTQISADTFHELILNLSQETTEISNVEVTSLFNNVKKCCKEYLRMVFSDYEVEKQLQDEMIGVFVEDNLEQRYPTEKDVLLHFSRIVGELKVESRSVEILTPSIVIQLQNQLNLLAMDELKDRLSLQLSDICYYYSYGRDFPIKRKKTRFEYWLENHKALIEFVPTFFGMVIAAMVFVRLRHVLGFGIE
mmetsp:Transcript_30940/g.33810  ORF Transcript_30940/g.33810 Transcript_30940/m.33810 type:complete len:1155 (+) Transcript_30940:97-3561(+)